MASDLAAVASFRLGAVRLALDANLGAHAYRLDSSNRVQPAASLALLVLFGL